MSLKESRAFDVGTQFKMLLKCWVALDPESGAFLGRSNGRMTSGRGTRYVLILPNKTPEERGGFFVNLSDWDYPTGRKFIAAYSNEEAVEKANEALRKMLTKRKKASNESNS